MRNLAAAAAIGVLLSASSTASVTNRLPKSPVAGTHFRECADCPEMVAIPVGSFSMGSPKSEAGRFDNEGPEHPVTISRPFAMGAYDVTVVEYRAFASATGRAPATDCRIYRDGKLVRVPGKNWRDPDFKQTDRDPVVCVTWDDAKAYAEWLNSRIKSKSAATGPYRLPTEAEWEYAARAGTVTPFYWGSAIRRSDANYGPDEPRFAPVALGADRWEYTSPGGSFPANAFGLFDMAGNVWQFTADCWHLDYTGAPTDGSARNDGQCDERVVRGGSWFKPPAGERSAKRGEGKAVDLQGSNEIGFRVARDLNQ